MEMRGKRVLVCDCEDTMPLEAGRLARGAPADLILFDPNKPRVLDPESFRSKSKNSPFEGHPVQGEVLRTIVDGRSIFQA